MPAPGDDGVVRGRGERLPADQAREGKLLFYGFGNDGSTRGDGEDRVHLPPVEVVAAVVQAARRASASDSECEQVWSPRERRESGRRVFWKGWVSKRRGPEQREKAEPVEERGPRQEGGRKKQSVSKLSNESQGARELAHNLHESPNPHQPVSL